MAIARKPAPAAAAVLKQATALWPKRSKASDGLLPSLAHQKQNPNSDHNTGLAVDLTHDPKNGVDCGEIFQLLKQDKRVKYLIFNHFIWVRENSAQGDKPYTGANPHKKHLHISINPSSANDTSPWFAWAGNPSKVGQIKAKFSGNPKKNES